MRSLPNCIRYSEGLLRLPLYYNITEEDQNRIIHELISFL